MYIQNSVKGSENNARLTCIGRGRGGVCITTVEVMDLCILVLRRDLGSKNLVELVNKPGTSHPSATPQISNHYFRNESKK